MLLNREELFIVLENIKVSKGSVVWIHHPITEELILVNVLKVTADKVLVSIPEDSPYHGQPDFYMKKVAVIGVKK
jgi:hypothetical protein